VAGITTTATMPERSSPTPPSCTGATARPGPSKPRSGPDATHCHGCGGSPCPRRSNHHHHAWTTCSPRRRAPPPLPVAGSINLTCTPQEAPPPSSVARLCRLHPPTEARGGREEGGRGRPAAGARVRDQGREEVRVGVRVRFPFGHGELFFVFYL
jgi:hypothetical protein